MLAETPKVELEEVGSLARENGIVQGGNEEEQVKKHNVLFCPLVLEQPTLCLRRTGNILFVKPLLPYPK